MTEWLFKKKAHPIKSDELLNIFSCKRLVSDLSVPITIGMELAPYVKQKFKQVAKVSSGHNPPPFLISNFVKNWYKDISENFT